MMASAWEKNYHHSDLEKAAAFLPSLLADSSLRSKDDDQTVHGVLLFADVSGFTALTEKFVQKSGTDRGTDGLAQTLNEYLCDILGEFLVFGGDILKFAGDAVLVLWRTPPRELARTISLVLHCSLQIQKKYRRHETDVGQEVQLKIGISAGTMSLSIFGDRRQQYFCIFGRGVGEVHEAEELADAGDIVLSATAWELCEQHRLKTKHLAGQRAVKVTGMEPMSWSECQDALHKLVQDPLSHRSEGEGAMRPALLLPSDPNAEKVYRKYIPDSALGKLDERVPLELFSELRPVTIIFIQLQLPADVSTGSTSTILNTASSVMVEILSPHKGKINQVLLCDKKVNLAARMMVHYPGLVSCDAVTYDASRLPHYYFRELPEREMKGIIQPGPVYQYVGITEESIFGLGFPKKRSEYIPLLGRKQEIDLFLGCLNAYRDLGQRNILAFEGTTGSGKSHLLTELASLGSGAGHSPMSSSAGGT
ncbi:adenylate cyclase type 10 [Limosa lapponica baueri]|uniref:Adenylate cyclase type 10 n=1 Tax=Limosa lapponica baueri TaxID=1758121 RepID=A0A2I0T8X0_LIMLA|nr:adenylate cyclase type 10 [Limosa lapponica baueri]